MRVTLNFAIFEFVLGQSLILSATPGRYWNLNATGRERIDGLMKR